MSSSIAICTVILLLVAFPPCRAFVAHAWSFSNDVETNEMKGLVFGGNGFLGSTVVTSLLEQGLSNMVLVNRGGKYWDSESRVFEKVRANVECDREEGLDKCSKFLEEIDDNTYDFVLDFSVASGEMMTETVELLKNKVLLLKMQQKIMEIQFNLND